MSSVPAPYYELRLYKMLPTRLRDFHDLIGRAVPPLFAKCGVSAPLGFWESYAGPFSPLLGYILPWTSIDDRMAAWTKFYADPDWQRELAANYAGAQRVDRPSVLILRPSPLWAEFLVGGPTEPITGIHEMRFYRGDVARSTDELRQCVGLAADSGAQILGVFEAVIGMPTDTRIVFMAWTGDAARLSTRDQEARRFPEIAPATQIMHPTPYGVPRTDLMPREG